MQSERKLRDRYIENLAIQQAKREKAVIENLNTMMKNALSIKGAK